MRKSLLLPLNFGLILVAITALSLSQIKTSAGAAVYTCTPDSMFVDPATGPSLLSAADTSKIALANSWLTKMLQPNISIATTSTITPDQDYTPGYTGATSGSFVINDRTYSTVPTASIVVDAPSAVPDAYRGVISGHVTMTPSPLRWIIQAYKNNGGTITQVPVQALANGSTGAFSIDLSGVSNAVTGKWMLGVLDATASYAEYGTKWPSPDQYVNLEVQELVVTDTTYLWATALATADGRFSFPNDQVGTKMFRLVEISSGDILAQSFTPTGLIRSYQYQVGEVGYGTGIQDLTYVYDQAVALFAAVSQSHSTQAKQLVGGLLKMQTTSGGHAGGFVFAAPQLSPTYTNPYYRTGADAIAVDALLAYIKAYPGDTDIVSYKAAATSALDFLQSLYSTSGATAGLYLGGFGTYSGTPETFDPSYAVTFASTEHNIDVWHALTSASQVLGNSVTNYVQRASDLDAAITAKLYNMSLGRLNQGINTELPDTGDPLDVNTWGAIYMYATGKTVQANAALAHLTAFENTVGGVTGYAPFYDSPGYPGALANVWFEGSFGAALAQFDVGNYSTYRSLLDQLTNAQEVDGSFRYSKVEDLTYGIGVSKSVASTAWYILATAGRRTIWNNCMYMPPAAISAIASPLSTSQQKKITSASSSTDETSLIPVSELAHSQSSQATGVKVGTVKTVAADSELPKATEATVSPVVIVAGTGAAAVVAGASIWAVTVRMHRRKP
jgi:hypothetical protein